jgi:hypothetical protein
VQLSIKARLETYYCLRTNDRKMGEGLQNQEMNSWYHEKLEDAYVRYIFDTGEQILVFENVPARVNPETGEQFFAPAIVRRIQQVAMSSNRPTRTIQAAVYEFAA